MVKIRVRTLPLPWKTYLPIYCPFFWNHSRHTFVVHMSSMHSVGTKFPSGNKIIITGAHYFKMLVLLSLVSYLESIYVHATRSNILMINTWTCNNLKKIMCTRVRFPAGRPWNCIFRNWSRFGSYNVYLNNTRISCTQL